MRYSLFISLSLLLSGCAAAMDASAGRTPGARCLVKYDAVIQVPRTAWGTSATPLGYEYPAKQLVGWDFCHQYAGNLVQVMGAGDIGLNTRTVMSLMEPHCVGSIDIAALDDCRGGESFTEQVFPFTKPMPVLRQY